MVAKANLWVVFLFTDAKMHHAVSLITFAEIN